MGKIFAAVILIFLVYAYISDFTDSDNIPYSIKGIDVYVVDKGEDKTIKVNEIYTSYFDSDTALKTCKLEAETYASTKDLGMWSYHCCTVTPGNDCVTKIK
jgi:hypothetical protein|tara:strand:+ start:496 stop:798 length:303 start_codon:yes stop_codon:yes gene_type:complete